MTIHWSRDEVFKLLNLIEERPILWDKTKKGYRISKIRNRLLKEISREFDDPLKTGRVCILKLFTLRSQYSG